MYSFNTIQYNLLNKINYSLSNKFLFTYWVRIHYMVIAFILMPLNSIILNLKNGLYSCAMVGGKAVKGRLFEFDLLREEIPMCLRELVASWWGTILKREKCKTLLSNSSSSVFRQLEFKIRSFKFWWVGLFYIFQCEIILHCFKF